MSEVSFRCYAVRRSYMQGKSRKETEIKGVSNSQGNKSKDRWGNGGRFLRLGKAYDVHRFKMRREGEGHRIYTLVGGKFPVIYHGLRVPSIASCCTVDQRWVMGKRLSLNSPVSQRPHSRESAVDLIHCIHWHRFTISHCTCTNLHTAGHTNN